MSKLQEQRAASGITRQQLSKKSGVNLRTIEAYEQEKKDINNAKLKTLLKLCKALDCNLKDIITDEETIDLLRRE